MEMKFTHKIKAIKDGRMDEYEQLGEFFCHKDRIYNALILKNEREEDSSDVAVINLYFFSFYVDDELDIWNAFEHSKYQAYHGMDKEFFEEYFEIIEKIS